ncbi:hypothetical protein [Lactiplantibacillus fabifermentans]|uniref:Uncharacterized protein n=2 Tax=Lactiplantibacillus fabifermentans TaxID=483011 RepID=A0A0R2NPD3_9LACO|nr:hypothetical protein [Lactiplantibacillus fabifermentans]ETY75526.1 hypothetical protein LFAB_01390 [Lactiplantibacillus fabifermentans T30PCM01]KRO27561.1 hypothetical protein DY78_GL003121 [Lactiplantibacillus fabifermentans DSM 21115]
MNIFNGGCPNQKLAVHTQLEERTFKAVGGVNWLNNEIKLLKGYAVVNSLVVSCYPIKFHFTTVTKDAQPQFFVD